MENKFETKIYTLSDIVKEELMFIIPSYQRPYVWSNVDVTKLLDDFIETLRPENYTLGLEHYYIGTILMYEQKVKGKRVYQVIDGQQRFTTLWLIAAAYRFLRFESCCDNIQPLEEFLKVEDELRIDFAIRKQIKSYMISLLDNRDGNNQYSSEFENDEDLINVVKAITTIIGKLKTIENQEERKDLGNFIYHNVKFVVNIVPEKTDLNKLFTTINNSGIQLEQTDILKSMLLKKITKQKTLFSRVWEACENMNNFFERNVRLLFPQEFDWEKTEYNDLKNFKLSTNDYREQVNTNPLTITDILQKKAKCNLRIDLRKTTRIENLNLSEIDEVSGKFYGAWIGEIDADYFFINRNELNKLRIQFQTWDDNFAKGVELELSQNDNNVDVCVLWAKGTKKRNNNNRELLGTDWDSEISELELVDIANVKTGNGYGISEIIINPTNKHSSEDAGSQTNNTEPDNIDRCRSIITFPQLLLHTYRIFLYKRKEDDFSLPFHTDKLLQIFSALTTKDEDTIKDFLKCLWSVRFVFDKEVVKWIPKEDEKEDVLQLTSISKADNSFIRTNKGKSEKSMLQSMLYFTGNYNTQIWLTPYLLSLLEGGDSLTEDGSLISLERIDNILSLSSKSNKEVSFALMDDNYSEENLFDFVRYLEGPKGTSFRHYWFQKLEYILWKEFNKNDNWKNDRQFKDYRITSKNSIEHVFPQHHEFAQKTIDAEHLNDFGNLALLNVSQNSSYSNQDVQKKKIDFDKQPTYDSLKLALIYKNKNLEFYNKDVIKTHRDDMIERIKKHYEQI